MCNPLSSAGADLRLHDWFLRTSRSWCRWITDPACRVTCQPLRVTGAPPKTCAVGRRRRGHRGKPVQRPQQRFAKTTPPHEALDQRARQRCWVGAGTPGIEFHTATGTADAFPCGQPADGLPTGNTPSPPTAMARFHFSFGKLDARWKSIDAWQRRAVGAP